MDTFYTFRTRGRLLAGLGSLVDPESGWDSMAMIAVRGVYVCIVFPRPIRVPGPSKRASKGTHFINFIK